MVAASILALGLWGTTSANAGGETRSISIYHTHTKESLTVTYMVNGKYVPSAMKKINYILRDWRRNETITIDPKTINLMWELHADLGSKKPVHIVSGYRSPKTNAFLKRIGRNVARKSQHMKGKAIDIYFPDVATKTMRNSALVRLVGGVGYYRSGGGPTGFLHIDSGNVRHWGPGISRREMASIFSKYKKTVGARRSGSDSIMVATRENAKSKAIAGEPSIYDGLGDEVDAKTAAQLAKLASSSVNDEDEGAENAAADTAAANAAEPVAVAAKVENTGPAIPKPRAKPIEVLMMAAANMQIEPASAPPPTQVEKRKRPVVAGVALATIEEPSIDDAIVDSDQTTNKSGKGSFAEDLNAIKPAAQKRKAVLASTGGETNWWPEAQANNEPQQPVVLDEAAPSTTGGLAVIEDGGSSAEGKGDMLVIDRSGKGSLPAPLPALIKG